MKVLATLSLLISGALCAQVYPGTNQRPILSDQEAALFTKQTYLQGWTPPYIATATVDYTVGGAGGYKTIQAAVNAAIKDGGTVRKVIKITTGTYNEVIYIPPTAVPITLFGADSKATSTLISLALSSHTTGSAYKALVGHLFNPGDPGYKTFADCASKPVIGTSCSSVVWARAANVQIVHLTIQNQAAQSGSNPAIALYTEGDGSQVSSSRILGHQETFWSGPIGNKTSRGHVTNTYIEGDLDFVFGGGSTVFEVCTFYAKSDRKADSAVIFAPATAPALQYGFLVIGSKITGDSSWLTSKKVRLARAKDSSIRSASAYIAGVSPNGQLVVRQSNIDDILPAGAPYAAATSQRSYAGNANNSRDLNDPHFNRFYEFANTGKGA